MNLYIKGMLMCLIAMSLLAIPSAFSYFSDEETSEENVFTAGEWTMDDWCLEVDTSRTKLTYAQGSMEPKLHLTEFRNRCDHPITIETLHLDIVWYDESGDVWIEGGEGEAYNENVLGTLRDGINPTYEWESYVVNPMSEMSQDGWRKLTFSFTGPIEKDVTMTFTMSDGSVKVVHWPEELPP